MAVVGAGAEVVHTAISELQLEQTCIACFNAPKGQPISGPASEVEHLIQKLRVDNANLFVRKLSTDDVVYHAPYLNAFRDYLRVQFGFVAETQPYLPRGSQLVAGLLLKWTTS